MDLEKIKRQRDCWTHCDAFNSHWYDYIKLDMVDYLISETERNRMDIYKFIKITAKQISEIEQLRKEKEWMLDVLTEGYIDRVDPFVTECEARDGIVKEMYRAIKEKK